MKRSFTAAASLRISSKKSVLILSTDFLHFADCLEKKQKVKRFSIIL